MFTLDANIFLRDLDSRSQEHTSCSALLQRLRAANISIVEPMILLVEIAGTISRETRDPMRARVYVSILREIAQIRFIPIDNALSDIASEVASDYMLRGMDAIYVAVAQRYNCTLISLDREVQTRASTIVSVQHPAEALANLSL